MYFHIPESIYLTYYNNQVIALNLFKNQYILLPKDVSEIIHVILHNKFKISPEGKYCLDNSDISEVINFNHFIEELQYLGILSNKKYEYPYKTPPKKKEYSAGAANVDWRMPFDDYTNKISKKIVLQAYLSLIKVYIVIKFFGFYGLIRYIKQQKNKNIEYLDIEPKKFICLAIALNRACFYFPIRVKCLEWSAALTTMGLKKKWKCNMEVGVQLLPFRAHAWVKVNNNIIADDPGLSKTLSIILSEPFTN